jgi:hypothetical protein
MESAGARRLTKVSDLNNGDWVKFAADWDWFLVIGKHAHEAVSDTWYITFRYPNQLRTMWLDGEQKFVTMTPFKL